MIGQTLGPYQVLFKLGEGGMGEVYRARDTKLDRDVAIKILPASVAGDSDRLARFEREAKALAALNHPHIVVQGAEMRNAPFPPYGLAWCESGLLFTRWAEGFWLASDDGRESLAFPLDPKSGDQNFAYPSCLPDGRVLAVAHRSERSVIVVRDARVALTGPTRPTMSRARHGLPWWPAACSSIGAPSTLASGCCR